MNKADRVDTLKIYIKSEKKEITMFNIRIIKNDEFLDNLKLNKNGLDQFLCFSEGNYKLEVFYE